MEKMLEGINNGGEATAGATPPTDQSGLINVDVYKKSFSHHFIINLLKYF